jgi:uncharacterized protein
MNPILVGLISDTHGLLRPEATAALRGSNLIIHAGDIGNPQILEELKSIAPTFAVRGNIDTQPWASAIPPSEIIELAGTSIYVLHDLKQLDIKPAVVNFKIVVSGHTHQPESRWHAGVLYINPGSAGPKRFSLPISLARLDLCKTPWQAEFINLSDFC